MGAETSVKARSLDELYTRAEELRHDFAELSEGTRQGDSESIRKMCEEVELIDHEITLASMSERRATANLASTSGGLRGDDDMRLRSFGELVTTPEVVEWAKSNGAKSSDLSFDIEGQGTIHDMLRRGFFRAGGVSGRDSGTRDVQEWASPSGPPGTYDASGAGYLLPVGQPIPPVPRQAKLYLRDLLPSMTTTLAQVPYVREVTPTAYELGASAVAEGGTKPNATLDFIGAKADPTVLATTLVLSKQLFEDAAAVVQYINNRLPYLVKFKEDWEFLNGSGTWPDIQGILNAGPQTQATIQSGGTNDNAQTLGSAFALCELADGAPTFVVLNPADAWFMFTKRAAGGSGTFDAGTPFSALPLTVWGVPTYRTRAIAAGTALVADGERGAMIVDRESVNVQTYRERYAELNQVLLVCEERVGLAIWRPDLFVQTTVHSS
jgi:hypothetical protein